MNARTDARHERDEDPDDPEDSDAVEVSLVHDPSENNTLVPVRHRTEVTQ